LVKLPRPLLLLPLLRSRPQLKSQQSEQHTFAELVRRQLRPLRAMLRR